MSGRFLECYRRYVDYCVRKSLHCSGAKIVRSGVLSQAVIILASRVALRAAYQPPMDSNRSYS
ncbi:hypothetical protein IEC33019_3384 [Pseudomonas putida]|uniref:Uncharacterized protein n=1 Tax=Pseudomonas putida TaxID=303 RepID=A0A1B2F9L2_PSEPU|nr:hypothetical protein IEC33019_3384 [Pseudomonas putida]